jgi:hypothetical protein
MIEPERLHTWEREALAQLSRHHGTPDERGELAARMLALIFEVKDLARQHQLAG